jgi:enamine deaminase RidA (YjgF/YER057c/UK114 family)
VQSPAFTNAIAVSGAVKTIYVGGQNAMDASGAVVGADLATQSRRTFQNLRLALAAGGARLENIVKWTIYVVEGESVQTGFEVFQQEWDAGTPPPAITGVFVKGLAVPGLLVEIDAVAVMPLA